VGTITLSVCNHIPQFQPITCSDKEYINIPCEKWLDYVNCENFIGLILFVSTSTDKTQSYIIHFLLHDSERFIPTSTAVTKHTHKYTCSHPHNAPDNSHHCNTQTVHVMMAGSTALAAPSPVPHILLQSIPVDIMFLLTINIFLWHADMCHV